MSNNESNKENMIINISLIHSNKSLNTSTNKSKVSTKESEILKLFCNDINSINEKDECNWTPLYRSIISGNLKATEILLNNGADPNIQCSMGETPLYQAVDMEKNDHVKLLLKYRADPNISQIDGLSSLHLAVLKQNIIIIKYLLKYKANPNKQSSLYNQTPVHLAIKNNVDSMILLILANYGGSLTIKDKFGKKPIDYIKSEEMRKTVEMLKLEKISENVNLKKIYFTPSKNNKFEISNVISKTIKSVSPKLNGIKDSNNLITLKDSGKTKINIVELKSGGSNEKEDNCNVKDKEEKKEKENINDILKINLFNPEPKIKNNNKNNITTTYYTYKRANYFYKNKKFANKNNIFLNNSNKNNFKIIESPIQEESSSIISTNKYYKNTKNNDNSHNKNNKSYSSFTKSNNTATKNNIFKTEYQKKYIRKKSTDKISSFQCNSNNKYKRNNTEDVKSRRTIFFSSSNKNLQNSRNNKKIDLNELNNKTGNFLTNNSITNSLTETLTNYKTQLTTNSNKGLKDKNSSSFIMKDDKLSLSKKSYIKPKIFIKSSNNHINKNILLENPLIKAKIMRNKNKNKNKNFFNSKNHTFKHFPTSKLLINKNENQYNNILNNNKENISTNINNSIFAISCRNSNNGKTYSKNSYNSSQSSITYYTYKKNENNNLLEVVEKSKNLVYKNEELPIYKWLKEIDLLKYLPLFIKKKIYSFQRIISDLKAKKIIITPNNIRKIGIDIPGHIYRIFVKLELDAELIDKKIYEYLLLLKKEEEDNNKKNEQKGNEESAQSLYDCCGIGCCSLKQSHIKIKVEKNELKENKVILDLEKWLKSINMIKYKDNFIQYGFDKIEFFILQMFSSLPLEEKIFEKEIHIENNNDIDMFILQLNKDVKFISSKFKKKRSSSVEVDKGTCSKYLLSKDFETKKKMTRTSSNICNIF